MSAEPDAPDGYQEPYEPVTAISWWELLPGEIGLLVGTAGLFGGLAVLVRDSTAVVGVFWNVLTLDSVGVYLLLLAGVAVTIVLHEVIHGLAGYVAGCEVRFQRRGVSVGTRLRGGFVTRRADVLITLAPAVVLTAVGLPLLVVVDTAVAAALVVTGLVANAAGVGSDIADVLALGKLPPGTLLYYGDDDQFAYEPAVSG